jgi:hypothetical protein
MKGLEIMEFTKLIKITITSAFVLLPSLTVADSQLSIGGAGTTAQANLDFRITIPNFVYFQIGSAGSVDRVDYDLNVGPVQPGSGGPVSATGGTGDGVDGALTVNLATNATSISIAATGGNLTSGADTIPFADITANDTGTIPVPDFGTTITPFAPGGFSLTDTWTYTYDNSSVYNAGTYDGRATYTITVL